LKWLFCPSINISGCLDLAGRVMSVLMKGYVDETNGYGV
jgi:hypothetical protein